METLPEERKKEFREYLEREGVIDHVTRALVALLEQEQSDAPLSVLSALLLEGTKKPKDDTSDKEDWKSKAQTLEAENAELKARVKDLEAMIASLQ